MSLSVMVGYNYHEVRAPENYGERGFNPGTPEVYAQLLERHRGVAEASDDIWPLAYLLPMQYEYMEGIEGLTREEATVLSKTNFLVYHRHGPYFSYRVYDNEDQARARLDNYSGIAAQAVRWFEGEADYVYDCPMTILRKSSEGGYESSTGYKLSAVQSVKIYLEIQKLLESDEMSKEDFEVSGQYIDEISKTGSRANILRMGCQSILFSEVLRLAEKEGWSGDMEFPNSEITVSFKVKLDQHDPNLDKDRLINKTFLERFARDTQYQISGMAVGVNVELVSMSALTSSSSPIQAQ